VRFEKGEPFCFITCCRTSRCTDPAGDPAMDSNPELRDQYDMWEQHRSEFNNRIFRQDPEAVREAWKRYYFKGEFPEEVAPAREGHVNKRRMKAPRFGA
jgi:hypothetical protein